MFVVGASNRPDQIEWRCCARRAPALAPIILGLPDEPGLAILRLRTARMPTVDVRLEELAAETEGLSPAS